MLDCSNGHYYSAPLLISVPLVGNFVITFHHDWRKLLIFWLWPWPCNLAQWRRRSNSVPILSLRFKIPSMLVVDFLCFCDSQRRTSLAVCYARRKQRHVNRANPQIDGELTWDELNSMVVVCYWVFRWFVLQQRAVVCMWCALKRNPLPEVAGNNFLWMKWIMFKICHYNCLDHTTQITQLAQQANTFR